MSFFGVGVNPFSTPVGHLVEQATDASLASENWGLNMEICDAINDTDEGPKDAGKAIKKRLSSNAGKNYSVVMYTLTVLETCVKNCGKRFHMQIATKDFMGELVKVIGPKNDPPQVVQEKILSLIQTWADAFRGSPELKEAGKVYQDLKNKGIEFPMTDLDAMAPIHTPARTGPDAPPPNVTQSPQRVPSARAAQYQVPAPQPQPMPMPVHQMSPSLPVHQPMPQQVPQMQQQMQPQPVVAGPVMLTGDQLGKLRSELDVVQQNYKVFGEMLTELTPGQEEPSDLELLQELSRTCRQMQARVVDLIERVANEEVTGELLTINDEINNAFLRYDRFERYRSQARGTQPNLSNASTLPIRSPAPAEPAPAAVSNLIDLDTPSPQPAPGQNNPFASDITSRMAGLNVDSNSVSSTLGQMNTTPATAGSTANDTDEFDMFAQSRQGFEQSRQAPPGESYANQQPDQLSGGLGTAVNIKNTGNPYADAAKQATDVNEIKLSDKESDYDEMEKWLKQNPPAAEGPAPESATSTEFDSFLASRVSDETTDNRNSNRGRTLQKDDKDSALFAL